MFDWVGDAYNKVAGWLGGSSAPGSDYAKNILDNGQNATVGPSHYQGDWSALVKQLQDRASGNGPSLAGMAYQKAADNGYGQLQGMAAGSNSPGMALNAARQAGLITQGLGAGYGQARAKEMQDATDSLDTALQGADTADFRRKQANQAAYMQALQAMMGSKSNWQSVGNQILGFASGGLLGAAQAGAPKGQ